MFRLEVVKLELATWILAPFAGAKSTFLFVENAGFFAL